MKVKFFLESHLNTLETQINNFTEEKEIKNIKFLILGNSFSAIVLYEERSEKMLSKEESIKQLESLKRDRESFVIGDKEHDEIYLKDIEAIKTVLKELRTREKN